MSSASFPRAELRKLLNEKLHGDAMLDAFCLDHFSNLYRQFTKGMEREQKLTLLLSQEDPEQIRWILDAYCSVDSRPSNIPLKQTEAHEGRWSNLHSQQLNSQSQSMRQLLEQTIHDDVNLRALCLDYLPHVLRHFSANMSFAEMLNQVLLHATEADVMAAMHRYESHHQNAASRENRPKSSLAGASSEPPMRVSNPGITRNALLAPGSAYEPGGYISRPDEETLALDMLGSRGAAVVLQGPEHHGKSWLLHHLLRQVGSQGSIVFVDMKELSGSAALHSSLDFLRLFAWYLLERAGIADLDSEQAEAIISAAFSRTQTTPITNLSRLVERHVLPTLIEGRWLIIAIDGADLLFGQPACGDFFTLLRAWMGFTSRSEWAPVRILLTLSTAPHLAIRNIDQSPFNIAETIFLRDFTLDQIGKLCQKYDLVWAPADCQRLLDEIGGHPYLVHRCLYEAARRGWNIDMLINEHAALFNQFLDQCARRLRRDSNLAQLFLRVLNQPSNVMDFEATTRLEYAGFLVRDGNCWRIRLPIYRLLAGRLR